jgi:uncharacterized protein YkwD
VISALGQALLDSALNPNQHEGSMVDLTNQSRAAAGLGNLTFDPTLLEIARQRAAQQAMNPLNHYDPAGELIFSQLLQQAGLLPQRSGENLARIQNQWQPQAVQDALMNSPTHRQNILDPTWTRFAIGEANPADNVSNLAELFR